MRILLFCNLYPPYVVGGNEILARDVVEALRRRGHSVHVGTGRGVLLRSAPGVHSCLNVDLDRLSLRFLGGKQPDWKDKIGWQLFDPLAFASSARLISAVRPDLIILWNLSFVSAAALLAARLSRRPYLAHVADKWLLLCLHDLAGLWQPRSVAGAAYHALRQHALQRPLRALCGYSPIIAISEFVRRYYLRAGIAAADIRAVHLGVPTRAYAPPAGGRKQGGLVRALCAGSLWAGKGAHIALFALGKLVNQHGLRNIHLDIYGEGADAYKQTLAEIRRGEKTEDYVTMHGHASRAEIIGAMQTHDVHIFPSLWDEPFAAVPVEAMSCGLPVIASSAGGTAEAITSGHDGVLVQPGDIEALADAWQALALDAAERRRLGENARATAVARFDFDQYVANLEALYQEQAARPRSG